MASLRIYQDSENAGNVRGKGQENAKPKRPVLGIVNSNAENVKSGKAAAVVEKAGLKAKLTTRNAAGKIGIQQINGPARAPCKPFHIFQDEPDDVPKPVLHENKSRALKERPLLNLLVPSHTEHLKPCQDVLQGPSSPAISSESPMDVSLKSEPKVSKECEEAQRDLDHLNLTERLYMCEEYRDDISIYLRNLQLSYRPRRNYMTRQPDITYHMRAVLVDWLVEVVEEYKMTNDTLYLAVSYIDRFLSSMSVVRNKLQLVGTAAMFIAAKYEEIYPPDVKDFVYITDDTYTKKQVLRMEHLILRILEFNLSVPTALNFLTDYTSHYPTPDNVKYLAMYLCELSLLQGDPYLGFLPSEIAAAAMCVARNCLLPEEDVLPPELAQILDCELRDIIYIVNALEATHRSAETSPQQASREKFKTDKYLRVSALPPPETDCSSLLSKMPSTP